MARTQIKSIFRLIDAANNELPIEQQFLSDLCNSIEKGAYAERRKPSQTYKPSSMNCERQMVYQVLGKEPDENMSSYQNIGITESGTDRHIRIQKAIEGIKDILGVDCEYIDVSEFIEQRELADLEVKEKCGMETKLYHKKYNMSFMTDGIVKYKSKYFIFEFKTETADKFYARKGVDEKHYNQATAYSLAFGIDDVLFIYENRNTLDKKAYMKQVTEEERQTLIRRLGYCQSYVETNTIPPKPETPQRKTCNYCPYKNQCGKDS